VKILLATMRFGRGCYQGTDRYLADLGFALRRRGHEVAYLAGDPDRTRPPARLGEQVEADPPVFAYPSRGWACVRGVRADTLAPVLERLAPDVVHLANPAHIGTGLTEACRRTQLPYVITTMDYWWICPKATLKHYKGGVCDGNQSWRGCLRCVAADNAHALTRHSARLPVGVLAALFGIRALTRGMTVDDVRRWFHRNVAITECLNGAEHIIFPSAAIESRIRPLLQHDRYSHIPHGLDERWFPPALPPVMPRAAAPDRPPVIGFAGTLARHKAPHLLLEAVRQLGWYDCVLRLAGGTGEKAYVRRLHELAKGVRVDFVGVVPPARMPDFLRSLDALVVPSTWPENAPYVILEALASGIAVIGSRIGGIPEMIADAARLFQPGSAASLAEALRRWRESPSRNAGPPARIWTADEMALRTLRVYEQAAAPSR